MKNIKIKILLFTLFSFALVFSSTYGQSNSLKKDLSSIYDAKMVSIDGDVINLSKYEGKVLLIVNTASKCGFTNQYKGLEDLHNKYADKGLVILGFPSNQFLGQEPGTNKEIKEFCTANYGVSFQIFEKIDVNGKETPPLYRFLKEKAPFEGFENKEVGEQLINILSRFSPEFIEGNEIKWNFTKFIVSKDGKTIKRFETPTTPEELEKIIVSMF